MIRKGMNPLRQTHWHVITGAPCSGKTTVISRLEGMGYRVIHESARDYIDAGLSRGMTVEQIRRDALKFQSSIMNMKLKREKESPEDETVFLDRGIPDSIAYYQLSGLDPAEPVRRSRAVRYQKIFFFERLTLKKDQVRDEDENTAEKLDRLLRKAYEMLGYPLIFVPVLSVQERIDIILKEQTSEVSKTSEVFSTQESIDIILKEVRGL
jgi:predicted ATPase